MITLLKILICLKKEKNLNRFLNKSSNFMLQTEIDVHNPDYSMNFALYIAKRYLLSKSSNNAINFISIIAGIGIIIGSASLFIVLSGFAGLKDFSLQFTTLVDPDLKAIPSSGKSFFVSDEELTQLKKSRSIADFSKIIEEQVILSFDDKKRMATIKGVDENYQNVNKIDSVIYQGSWLTPLINQGKMNGDR